MRNPRSIRYLALSVVFVATFAVVASVGAEGLKIGSRKQLFVGPWAEDGRDDHLVESMKNVEMTMNPARVTGERLVVQDKPWEGTGILDMRQFVLIDSCIVNDQGRPTGGREDRASVGSPAVIGNADRSKDGDLFRMYYGALPHHFVVEDPTNTEIGKQYGSLWKKPYQRIICYAESKDGIHWTKPNLGLCQWEGSRENNIIFPNDDFEYVFSEMDGASVFIDPVAKGPEEKYKLIVKISPVGKGGSEDRGPIPAKGTKSLSKGQYVFASADAIHWKLLSTKKVNPGASDTQFSAFWDESVGKYVQYTRMKPRDPQLVEYYRKLYGGKAARGSVLLVGRAVSDNFLDWGPEATVFGPDRIDRSNSPEGLVRLDFYGGNVSKYSEAADVYIALPNAYYHWKFDLTRRWWSGKHIQLPSTMDVQLATSRDGIHWYRTPKRKPFIRLGPKGTFWSSTIWPDGNAIRVGDELWFYFAGLDVSHKEQSLIRSHGARGRAVLRLDGFISADADYTGGELTTRPLVFAGNRLQLNVDTSAGGICQVEIQDPSGKPVEGFSLADADEINGNYIRVVPSWNGNSDLSSLAGKPVKLRFVMRDAKLYSFQAL